MLGWLINKHVKKEIKDHIHNLQLHLANSFSNIKEDISNIHHNLNQKDKKILELEGKIALLENKMFYFSQSNKSKIHQYVGEEEKVLQVSPTETVSLVGLTDTQKTILCALFQLQAQLESPISFKSLASYLYPGKKYQAVRTTLSEYLDFLSTYNLVRKDKIGRETVATITSKGEKLAKEILNQKKQKKRVTVDY